jgi:hypothetical protein
MVAERAVDLGVGGLRLTLDVDQKLKGASPAGVDGAVVRGDPARQRLEVERLQGPVGLDLRQVVRDQELAADQPDVGLDAGETVVECIEERSLVLVVVVRVGLRQRPDARTVGRAVPRGCRHAEAERGEHDGEGEDNTKTWLHAPQRNSARYMSHERPASRRPSKANESASRLADLAIADGLWPSRAIA